VSKDYLELRFPRTAKQRANKVNYTFLLNYCNAISETRNANNDHVSTTVKKIAKNVTVLRTWFCITSSDDVKVCVSKTRPISVAVLLMYITRSSYFIPINSDTSWVGNTCIKTLLLCFLYGEPRTAPYPRVIRSDPVRWTAVNSECRCCSLTVI